MLYDASAMHLSCLSVWVYPRLMDTFSMLGKWTEEMNENRQSLYYNRLATQKGSLTNAMQCLN